MDDLDLEGSLILEKLAAIGKVESFLEAVDSDDLSTVKKLLRQANIEADKIEMVLEKIKDEA